jgi:hypothetical protein
MVQQVEAAHCLIRFRIQRVSECVLQIFGLYFFRNQDTLKLVIFHSCSDCSGIMYSKTSTCLMLEGVYTEKGVVQTKVQIEGSKNSIIS